MSRARWLLVGLLVAELVGGGFAAARRMNRVTPPVPDLADVDPVSAGEFRALIDHCHTAADWAKLGEAYLANGFFPEGEACLRQACQLDPESAETLFKHAFALERIGRIDEANDRYAAAIAHHHPRSADCWYYTGRNHLRLERGGPAAEAFERAGTLPGARFDRGVAIAGGGRRGDADAEAARLASEFANAYEPVSLRYRLAIARNDHTAAAMLADQFARRPRPLPTPFDTETDWIFGLANGFGRAGLFRDAGRDAQEGRFSAAEDKLRGALASRWEPEIADRLAEVAFVLGKREETARVLTEAVDRGGPTYEWLWRLGQAEDALGRPQRALELWQRAERLVSGPRGKELLEDLAGAYERAGQPDRAKPLAARAQLAAGLEALLAGRLDDAVKALTRAGEIDAKLAHAWFALGEAHRLAGRAQEARAAYDHCLKLDSDHGRAARALKLLGG
jgi:tetratricopeptide (TPR) repeat protein